MKDATLFKAWSLIIGFCFGLDVISNMAANITLGFGDLLNRVAGVVIGIALGSLMWSWVSKTWDAYDALQLLEGEKHDR